MKKNGKICFAASSGGHFEQIMRLRPLMEKYESFLVTEKTAYGTRTEGIPVEYVMSVNRTDRFFLLKFAADVVSGLRIVLRHRPELVISTGVLAVLPVLFWTKLFGGKVVYIESFAKISSPTLSGKIAYKFADRFYVQWKEMLAFYPAAVCRGGIY